MDEILNKGQQEALKLAVERYKTYQPYTYIAGPAGTGKSYLVHHIIAALNLNPEKDVCYIAYTGKAALNLQRKNCPNACTIHSLLYNARQNKTTGLYYFIPVAVGSIHFKLIVVDEISMVTQEMWDLLLSHGIYIIALGDIAQLPAIGTTNNILNKPHYVLTEIMRQDADSEIIQIATLAREHKEIPYMKGKDVQILHPEEYIEAMLDWSDITICATNKTRNALNTTARRRLWGDTDPRPRKGDKIVCLHNEWDTITAAGDTLVNGLVGYITDDPIFAKTPTRVRPYSEYYAFLNFRPDYREPEELNSRFLNLRADYKIFTEGQPMVNQKNFQKFTKNTIPYQFDYAYALTCHKAQGSEFNKVLVMEEKFPYEEDQHWKWLYTSISRAVDKLVLIKA